MEVKKKVLIPDDSLAPLYDDLNTPSYIANIHKLYEKAHNGSIEDKEILKNFKESFKSYFSKKNNLEINLIKDFEIDDAIINTFNLSIYGWKKEAIPVVQAKTSLIAKIFQFLFD